MFEFLPRKGITRRFVEPGPNADPKFFAVVAFAYGVMIDVIVIPMDIRSLGVDLSDTGSQTA